MTILRTLNFLTFTVTYCCHCYVFSSRLSNEGAFSARMRFFSVKLKLLKTNKINHFFHKTLATLDPDSVLSRPDTYLN